MSHTTERHIEQEIIQEIFVRGAYRGEQSIVPGERWLDVGCHNGWWTRYASGFEAEVVGAVDADRQALHRYRDMNGPNIVTIHSEIRHVEDLIRAHKEAYGTAKAVKLDIQGAERDLFLDPEQRDRLARTFGKVLVEWHYPRDLADFILALALHWEIRWLERADDTMTGERTYLALAAR